MEVLQARGRVLPKLALMKGMETGTFPVIMRQAQSMLFSTSDFKALQQPRLGEEPATILKHGVKLLIMELLHAVLICAFVFKIEDKINTIGRINEAIFKQGLVSMAGIWSF